jgi:hypothetical protein
MFLFITSLIVLGIIGSVLGFGGYVSGIGNVLWTIIEFLLEYAAVFIVIGIVIGICLHSWATR